MSAFLLITVIACAWLSGCWTTRALQGYGGGAYVTSLMMCAILVGIILIGYVAEHQY